MNVQDGPRQIGVGQWAAALLASSALLAACGGGSGAAGGVGAGGSGVTGASSTTISGVVSKGLVASASVTAYCGGQSGGSLFGSPATTDANGNYSISSTASCAQPIELVATSGSGTTEIDEASGGIIAATFTLKAYIGNVGTTNVQHITPLSDIAAALVDAQSGTSPTSAAVQSAVNTVVENVLDGDSATFEATPMTPAKAIASNDQSAERLAALLTGISAQANALASAHGTNGIRSISAGTAKALQDLRDAATSTVGGSGGTAAPSSARSSGTALVQVLQQDIAAGWYANVVIDPSAAQLLKLGSATPVLSAPTADSGAYSLGGNVSSLTGTGLVLQSNLGESLSVPGNGAFDFKAQMESGSTYAVRVLTQPAGQLCSIDNGTGTMGSASVTDVSVTCLPAYAVGGTVSGLASGASLILTNVNGDVATIARNGAFSLPTFLASGTPFSVTVATQPKNQICTVSSGSGVMARANFGGVRVSCVDVYAVSAVVSGLAAGGSLTLRLTAAGQQQYLVIEQNGTASFPNGLPNGTSFTTSVTGFPAGQGCNFGLLPWSSGTVSGTNLVANSVQVQCASGYFTVGGTVSGLAPGSTLVLADQTALAYQGDRLVVSSDGPYVFAAPVEGGGGNAGSYQVSIQQQPLDQNCTWAYGAGPLSAGSYLVENVTSLNIVCTPAYTLSGTVTTSSGQVVTSGFVTITGTQPFPGSSSNSETAYFDADGGFQLPVPPGTYTVTPNTGGNQLSFSPATASVVVGNSDPAPLSFLCTYGCPTNTAGTGGSIGTGTGSTGSGGSGGTYTCTFKSCVTPLTAACIAEFNDPSFYNWISFTNNCGQTIYLTFNAVGANGVSSMNLAPGQSGNTGLASSEVPNGFLLAVCPYGYIPWSATSNTSWNGTEAFICVE